MQTIYSKLQQSIVDSMADGGGSAHTLHFCIVLRTTSDILATDTEIIITKMLQHLSSYRIFVILFAFNNLQLLSIQKLVWTSGFCYDM